MRVSERCERANEVVTDGRTDEGSGASERASGASERCERANDLFSRMRREIFIVLFHRKKSFLVANTAVYLTSSILNTTQIFALGRVGQKEPNKERSFFICR